MIQEKPSADKYAWICIDTCTYMQTRTHTYTHIYRSSDRKTLVDKNNDTSNKIVLHRSLHTHVAAQSHYVRCASTHYILYIVSTEYSDTYTVATATLGISEVMKKNC